MQTLYEGFRKFMGCGKLCVTWYQLEQTKRPIGTFTVDTVPIIRLTGLQDSICFYPKLKAERKFSRYPPKRRRMEGDGVQGGDLSVGPNDGAAELEDNEDEGSEDEVAPFDDENAADEGMLAALLEELSGELLEPLAPPPDDAAQQPEVAPPAPDEQPPPAQVPPPPPPARAAVGPGGAGASGKRLVDGGFQVGENHLLPVEEGL